MFGGVGIIRQPPETRIASRLVHNNDLGREYDLKKSEPQYFRTAEVFQEFKDFFERKLEEIVQLRTS